MEISMNESIQYDFDVASKIEYYDSKRTDMQEYVEKRGCLKS